MRKQITADHLPINEAAAEYSIPYDELSQACRDGVLPSVKGRGKKRKCHYVTREDLQSYLNNTRKCPGDDCPTIEHSEAAAVANTVAQAVSDAPAAAPGQTAPATSADAPEMPNHADTPEEPPRERREKQGRKTQILLSKDSMRKLDNAALSNIRVWITNRLERGSSSQSVAAAPTPAKAHIPEKNV